MVNLFIELLQVSLGTRNRLSRVLNDTEWFTVFKEAQRQCVVGVIVDGLERLPVNQLPPRELLLLWIGKEQVIEGTYSLHCDRANDLTSRFRAAGFCSCILKGVGIAQYYPTPIRRQCGDIDVWVNGTRKSVVTWLKSQYHVDHVVWHHAEAMIFEDVSTEIHYHPSWMYNPFCNRKLQKWFGKEKLTQMDVDDKLGFAYPTPQFNAVYSLVHFSHHLIEEGIGIRHVVDYFYIMKALPVEDKTTVVLLLKRFGLYRLLTAMMWVLTDMCNMDSQYLICEPNEKEGRFLVDEMMRGGNFGYYRMDNRRRNTATRMMVLLPHYPSEVLWVVPWKLWHKCWRWLNG